MLGEKITNQLYQVLAFLSYKWKRMHNNIFRYAVKYDFSNLRWIGMAKLNDNAPSKALK